MSSAADGLADFRFSTRGLPKRERAAAVRDLHERGMIPVRLAPLPDRPLRVDIAKWSLSGLSVLSGVLGGVRQEGTAGQSARGGDDLFLGVNLAGSSTACQGGQEV